MRNLTDTTFFSYPTQPEIALAERKRRNREFETLPRLAKPRKDKRRHLLGKSNFSNYSHRTEIARAEACSISDIIISDMPARCLYFAELRRTLKATSGKKLEKETKYGAREMYINSGGSCYVIFNANLQRGISGRTEIGTVQQSVVSNAPRRMHYHIFHKTQISRTFRARANPSQFKPEWFETGRGEAEGARGRTRTSREKEVQ